MNDEQLLSGLPDFISIGSLLKANPVTEAGERFCYFEASNEGLDQQSEVVAAKALADSAQYFLRYGNIDIDHFTLLGKPNPAKGYPGIPNYLTYEIGRPVDVRQKGKTTFVKAQIYSGAGELAQKANDFWSSITELNPPKRWYPSVGGQVLKKSVEVDPTTKMRKAIIQQVRWNNIGVSQTPVNQHVSNCATVPIGAFAKSLTASGGLDLVKALEAGYGTDSASLAGGAALRRQSLHGVPDEGRMQAATAAAIRDGRIKAPFGESILSFASAQFGLSQDQSAEFAERFMRQLIRKTRSTK